MSTPGQPPLLVTDDELLLEDVLRLSAAAGVVLDVAHDVAAAQRGWSAAALVLVGADQAAALARTAPPRRQQVHVVARGPVPDGLFRWALGLGAPETVRAEVSGYDVVKDGLTYPPATKIAFEFPANKVAPDAMPQPGEMYEAYGLAHKIEPRSLTFVFPNWSISDMRSWKPRAWAVPAGSSEGLLTCLPVLTCCRASLKRE